MLDALPALQEVSIMTSKLEDVTKSSARRKLQDFTKGPFNSKEQLRKKTAQTFEPRKGATAKAREAANLVKDQSKRKHLD